MEKIILRNKSECSNCLKNLESSSLLQQIYLNRGITNQQELDNKLTNLLSYHDLLNIDKASELLADAIIKKKSIMIVGDYDVDGATSTVLMLRVLSEFGAKHIDFIIPDRFSDGYGLSPSIVRRANEKSADLLITVDNGINSYEGVDEANKLGITVIITDHHLPSNRLPQASCIVNPNQSGDNFKSNNLSGVGVSFYLLLAARANLRKKNWFIFKDGTEPNLAKYLDLVALGTIADVVNLDHNNRILVEQGLRRIRSGKCCPGITALLAVSKRIPRNIAASDLAYSVAPRLNAAGRLDDMGIGISCLLCDDYSKAYKTAETLDRLNRKRRNIEANTYNEAAELISKNKLLENKRLPNSVCLYDKEWHQGVIGIVANRIKDQLHRPVIIFCNDVATNYIKGSGRSINGIHLKNILSTIAVQNPNMICKFGGHAMAVGLTIEKDMFGEFSREFNRIVEEELKDNGQEKIITDGCLKADEITFDTTRLLQEAGPWGEGFPEPVFDGVFNIIEYQIIAKRHLKLQLKYDGQIFNAIAFNIDMKQNSQINYSDIHMVYHLGVNEFRGQKNVQLIIKYFHPVNRNT